MNHQVPAWRFWLIIILMVGWALLAVRFFISKEWLMVALCAILSVSNAFTLWRLKIQSTAPQDASNSPSNKVELAKENKPD